MTLNDPNLLDDFTALGVACTRAKISTSEFAMEALKLVDLIQKRHDVTRYCPSKNWWQLKCAGRDNGTCVGGYY